MKLYVMRHGYAGKPESDPAAERDRPLLAEGRATVLAIAKEMSNQDEIPNVIFCSPFARTVQTADIVGKALGIQVNVIGDLAPMRPLEETVATLVGYDKLKRVLLVGHVDNTTPSMNELGGDTKWDDLVMGEVRRVKIDRKDATWKLKWALKPSDLGLKDRKS